MNCSMPGLPVHHQLLEFTQTHVHQVGDAIQAWLMIKFVWLKSEISSKLEKYWERSPYMILLIQWIFMACLLCAKYYLVSWRLCPYWSYILNVSILLKTRVYLISWLHWWPIGITNKNKSVIWGKLSSHCVFWFWVMDSEVDYHFLTVVTRSTFQGDKRTEVWEGSFVVRVKIPSTKCAYDDDFMALEN